MDEGLTLKAGDLVKIELGAHIDGYPVLLAHSFVVSGEETVSDLRADLMAAAHTASEIVLRLFKNDKSTTDAADALETTVAAYGFSSVNGTISFELDRNTLGGTKYIIVNPTAEQRKSTRPQPFEDYDVFAVDVALTSGNGQFSAASGKPWIFRKTDTNHELRTKSARSMLTSIQNKYGKMAFNIRSLTLEPELEKANKLGFAELVKSEIIQGYETLYDKKQCNVARFMFTVVITPSGPLRITHWEPLSPTIQPSKSLSNPTLVELLRSDPRSKKRN